jgi:DNA-binding NarL/FixJ family response regulator
VDRAEHVHAVQVGQSKVEQQHIGTNPGDRGEGRGGIRAATVSQPCERRARLTEREREVAVAVGRGLSNAQISGELFMSVPTVKAHVSRLLAKLGADNRVQIALTVHDAGLT